MIWIEWERRTSEFDEDSTMGKGRKMMKAQHMANRIERDGIVGLMDF
jgi:hypothetical protein